MPIPGTKNPERIRENAGAAKVKLSESEMLEIEESIPNISGDRYDSSGMNITFDAREK